MFVYLITNTTTGKIYVGQHKGTNLKKYLQDKFSQARYELKRKGHGGGSHLFNSMRKHPKGVWEITPLVVDVTTREALDAWEKTLIELLDARNPEVGYNICKGGEGFTGEFTAEHRAKLGAAVKAWNADPNNAEVIQTRNHKLSEDKKAFYAECWVSTGCPVCKNSFSRPSSWGSLCCSRTCGLKYHTEINPGWVEKRSDAVRAAIQSPEYRANQSKIMRAIGRQQKQASLDTYYANPSICLYCEKVIHMVEGERLSVLRRRKFCNRQCSALYRKL